MKSIFAIKEYLDATGTTQIGKTDRNSFKVFYEYCKVSHGEERKKTGTVFGLMKVIDRIISERMKQVVWVISL